MLSHILCFMPRLRAPVLRLMLSDLGYWFFWLNNKRRRLKFWLRDMLARVVRKVRGRR